MDEIPQAEHVANYSKGKVERIAVPGGWLYLTTTSNGINPDKRLQTCFVADPPLSAAFARALPFD